MKRIGIGALALLALCITIGALRSPLPLLAQEKSADIGTIVITKETTDDFLKPVLVILLHNGKRLRAEDSNSKEDLAWSDLPYGEYEVHFEKEGFRTVVKRVILAGVQIRVGARLKPGKGAIVLGSPSLQDMDARLKRLEATVAALQKKIQR